MRVDGAVWLVPPVAVAPPVAIAPPVASVCVPLVPEGALPPVAPQADVPPVLPPTSIAWGSFVFPPQACAAKAMTTAKTTREDKFVIKVTPKASILLQKALPFNGPYNKAAYPLN